MNMLFFILNQANRLLDICLIMRNKKADILKKMIMDTLNGKISEKMEPIPIEKIDQNSFSQLLSILQTIA